MRPLSVPSSWNAALPQQRVARAGGRGRPASGTAPRATTGLLLALAVVGLGGLGGLGTGCGEGSGARFGTSLFVGADFNGWAKGAPAAELVWDGARYRGVVTLPGDELELRLYAPATGLLIGHPPGTPAQAVPSSAQTLAGEAEVPALRIAVPILARYELSFEPREGSLHIDLAEGAEGDQPPAGAALVQALRGADRLPLAERRQRADELRATLRNLAVETPLRWEAPPHRGLTFLHLDPVDYPELSLVGDFNGWTSGRDRMTFVLDGTVAYSGRRASGARLEYRFELHGRRYADPRNPEVVWDGATLPPSPTNLLGGNEGELNSVAYSPGYLEQGPRLRRLPLPPGAPSPEVLVYLPAGYTSGTKRYASLYVHDGKDALVRGRYDRTLARMAQAKQAPEVVAIFIAPPSDPLERLATFATNTDATFPEVTPHGVAYERFLTDTVLPLVEESYRTGPPRALLGIDMAGPLSFHLLWSDPKARFSRAASQSGRFGWGSSPMQPSPYLEMLKNDQGARIGRVALDYSDNDQGQASAAVHDAVQKLLALPSYTGKVQILRKSVPSASTWDCLRTRLESTLPFLLADLQAPPP